jgi:hypothetical protein
MSQVDPSQCKNKSGYYHSFKIQFEGRPGARPASQAGLIVNSGQYKDKNDYYHNFKTRLGGRLRQGLGHGLEKSTRVDLSQYINKNNYYNSFKTRLGSDLRQSSDHGWGELTWLT